MTACRVRLFDTGYCVHPEHVVLRNCRMRRMEFPAMFALIEHPERGPILFDTGYGQAYLDAKKTLMGQLYNAVAPVTTEVDHFAAARCLRAGVEPKDVSLVIASHFHADHIAGLADFPAAEILFFRSAWESVRHTRGVKALAKGFLPSLLPSDFEARAVAIEESTWVALPPELAPFAHGIDLLGDGSLVAVALPGHAAGQLGLFVRTGRGDPLFLVADACWTSRSFREEIAPSSVTRILFDDSTAYRQTLGRVAAIARSRPDMLIVPSHCGEVHERFVLRQERIA